MSKSKTRRAPQYVTAAAAVEAAVDAAVGPHTGFTLPMAKLPDVVIAARRMVSPELRHTVDGESVLALCRDVGIEVAVKAADGTGRAKLPTAAKAADKSVSPAPAVPTGRVVVRDGGAEYAGEGESPAREGHMRTAPYTHPNKVVPGDTKELNAKVRKGDARDKAKAVREATAERLIAGTEKGDVETLTDATAETLRAVCKNRGFKGYSGLDKGELVKFILAGGDAPAPKPGTARELRETAKELKAAGKLTGAVSSAKVADLRAAVEAANSGESDGPVTLPKAVKPTPKPGTGADAMAKLRTYSDRARLNEYCKATFGCTFSGLKAAQAIQAATHFAL